mmetsp:Transcript_97474/g.237031  ORF Transcript_97474/g.237031 Transcript_97474/m.237031 type:complete len:146 (+) Transcript_97474:171-608(+)
MDGHMMPSMMPSHMGVSRSNFLGRCRSCEYWNARCICRGRFVCVQPAPRDHVPEVPLLEGRCPFNNRLGLKDEKVGVSALNNATLSTLDMQCCGWVRCEQRERFLGGHAFAQQAIEYVKQYTRLLVAIFYEPTRVVKLWLAAIAV